MRATVIGKYERALTKCVISGTITHNLTEKKWEATYSNGDEALLKWKEDLSFMLGNMQKWLVGIALRKILWGRYICVWALSSAASFNIVHMMCLAKIDEERADSLDELSATESNWWWFIYFWSGCKI